MLFPTRTLAAMITVWACVEKGQLIPTFLVIQYLRIHLSMQGTGSIPSLWKFHMRKATKPVHRNYWACALEPRAAVTEGSA